VIQPDLDPILDPILDPTPADRAHLLRALGWLLAALVLTLLAVVVG